MKRLLVLIADRPSEIVAKGEYTPCYYNPGELFDEVHILSVNDDRVSEAEMQGTVGRATLFLHRLPAGHGVFLKSLGWRPWLLRSWAEPAVNLVRSIQPALVRCYGLGLNAYLAARIRTVTSVPYVISLHTDPDDETLTGAQGFKQRVAARASLSCARLALRNAACVMPVYESIVPFTRRMGAKQVQVVYNVLNGMHLRAKMSYRLSDTVQLLCVGRQIIGKNPENIVRAVGMLDGVHLTLVGDGALHRDLLRVAEQCGVLNRIHFVTTIPNDELCASLPSFDIYVAHVQYSGVSKSVLEPLLAGLPVIHNRREGTPVAEFDGDFIVLVDDTPDAYAAALRHLISDDAAREALGRRAYKHAQDRWAPAKVESDVMEVYRRVMSE